ncbi:MAG: GNAT family N-acetyltransferase [Halioglobus sp.]|nr:GNAT family N-acetyltransferase [Halioglobus sp.]
MQFSVVESWDELPASAVSLLEDYGRDHPFQGAMWFSLFSRYVAWGLGEPRWLLLQDGQTVHTVLPMLHTTQSRTRILNSMGNYYTPYFDVISRDASPAHGLSQLLMMGADFLARHDIINLSPLVGPVRDRFEHALQDIGFHIQTYHCSSNWREREITDFDRYWSQVNGRTRHTVERKLKKLQQAGDYLFSIAGVDEIERALLDYHEVYFKSWKVNEPFPAFIDELARQAARQNLVRLGLLHHAGRPVAAQLWFVAAGTAYIFKLAYDPAYHRQSVGSLLSHYLFREIIARDKVHTIDYLTGNDAYKADWMSETRELFGLQCANRRSLRGFGHMTSSMVRTAARLAVGRHSAH